MPAPAYMFVGAAESLIRLSTDLALEEIGSAFVYVKKTASEASAASLGVLDSWAN